MIMLDCQYKHADIYAFHFHCNNYDIYISACLIEPNFEDSTFTSVNHLVHRSHRKGVSLELEVELS